MRSRIALSLILAMSVAGLAHAHHSFAVFFDQEKNVTVKGTVTNYVFRNPHGLIEIDAKNDKGELEKWKVETNAPVILQRRGWTKDSLKVGDAIVLEGWPARNGTKYLRMRKVTRPDGSVIGTALPPSEEK
jgi:hypothetical protein